MCQIVKPDQMAVAAANEVLAALALGSSISICIYDERNRIGGMVHTLLPSPMERDGEKENLRYVNTAVLMLYEAMVDAGAQKEYMWAKLAGGARIFSFSNRSAGEDMGRKNVEQARQSMNELEIPVRSEDTGENYGRSAYFHIEDGRLEIETASRLKYTI